MKLLFFILTAICIGIIEGANLFRERKWWELTTFSLYLSIGLFFIIIDLMSLNPFRITAPADIFFGPLFKAVTQYLDQL